MSKQHTELAREIVEALAPHIRGVRGLNLSQMFIDIERVLERKVDADDELPSWVSTTEAFTRFISEEKYQKLNPEARRWYQPIAPGAGSALVRLLLAAEKANEATLAHYGVPIVDQRAIAAAKDALKDNTPPEPKGYDEIMRIADDCGVRWTGLADEGISFSKDGFFLFVESLLEQPVGPPLPTLEDPMAQRDWREFSHSPSELNR